MKRSTLIVAAVVLLGAAAAYRFVAERGPSPAPIARSTANHASATSRLVTLEVGGMVCAACVSKVRNTLAQVPGVTRVEVSLADQRARVLCSSPVADTSLTAAVRRAGPEYIGFVIDR